MGERGELKRKRSASDQTLPELQRIIRRLKTIITQASNEALAIESVALHVPPVEAAFYRELAQDLRERASRTSELLLKIEKLRAHISEHGENL